MTALMQLHSIYMDFLVWNRSAIILHNTGNNIMDADLNADKTPI